MRPQFERDVSHFEKELELLNTRKKKALTFKNEIISLIKKRADLKGVNPILSNSKTIELDNFISSYDTQITEKKNNIQQLKDKISRYTDYYYLFDKDHDIKIIIHEISKIKKTLSSLLSDNREIDKLILKEKMRSKYEEYAD
jgi:flagellar biosynthesis chaperone FliJ